MRLINLSKIIRNSTRIFRFAEDAGEPERVRTHRCDADIRTFEFFQRTLMATSRNGISMVSNAPKIIYSFYSEWRQIDPDTLDWRSLV